MKRAEYNRFRRHRARFRAAVRDWDAQLLAIGIKPWDVGFDILRDLAESGEWPSTLEWMLPETWELVDARHLFRTSVRERVRRRHNRRLLAEADLDDGFEPADGA